LSPLPGESGIITVSSGGKPGSRTGCLLGFFGIRFPMMVVDVVPEGSEIL
jgi:hypothetical protein